MCNLSKISKNYKKCINLYFRDDKINKNLLKEIIKNGNIKIFMKYGKIYSLTDYRNIHFFAPSNIYITTNKETSINYQIFIDKLILL